MNTKSNKLHKAIIILCFIVTLFIFLIQFQYIYDRDLIHKKTLTLSENDPKNPEGTCQSLPYKNYLPFSLTIQTAEYEYNFYCAPNLNYQVFVLCLGWLLEVIMLGFTLFSMFNLNNPTVPRSSVVSSMNHNNQNTKEYEIKYKQNEIKNFKQNVAIFGFYTIILLIFTMTEITHGKQTNEFCQKEIPNMKYKETVQKIDCDATSLYSLSIGKTIFLILLIGYYTLLFYHLSKQHIQSQSELPIENITAYDNTNDTVIEMNDNQNEVIINLE